MYIYSIILDQYKYKYNVYIMSFPQLSILQFNIPITDIFVKCKCLWWNWMNCKTIILFCMNNYEILYNILIYIFFSFILKNFLSKIIWILFIEFVFILITALLYFTTFHIHRILLHWKSVVDYELFNEFPSTHIFGNEINFNCCNMSLMFVSYILITRVYYLKKKLIAF